MKRRYLLSLILIFCSSLAYSQIMNVEKLRLESDSGWTGNVKGSYNINKSSSKIKQFHTNIHIQYKRNIHTFLIVSNLSFIKAGEENFENNGAQHFRYTRTINDWMSLEGFAQFQFNKVLKVNFRNLWGGGVRFEIFNEKKIKWFLGNIVMFEHEQPQNSGVENNLRLSYYVNFMWKLKDNISLNTITYIQPKMFDLPDYRLLWQSSLKFKVLQNLSVGIQHNWMNDVRPPENVPKVIYALRNTVSYSF